MKVIDEKGKLFGIINPVDLIVVVLILSVIGGFGYRMVSSKLNANGGTPFSKEKEAYVTLYANLVTPEVAESIKVGDKLVANNQYTNAEVVDVKVEPAAYVSPNSEGRAVKSDHPLWKDVTITVKDVVNPANVILKVGEQEVRVGYSFVFKTQTVEANSKIRGIELKDIEE